MNLRILPVSALLCVSVSVRPCVAQSYLVVVTGLPGTPARAAALDSVASTIVAAGRSRLGLRDERIVRLGPRTSPPGTAAALVAALERVASRAESAATVIVVLLGHGSAVGGEPRFNLTGPDLTPSALAAALARFPTQELVVINAASASGPWIETLSGPRRAVITATRSGTERDETVFPRYLAEAFAADGTDLDRDGRVSVREIFEATRQAVERHYRDLRRLRTEHALLEDDGDGRGALAPQEQGDGRRAGLLFLDGGGVPAGADAALTALLARRDSLYRELEGLRAARAGMDSTAYQAALDALLLDIARTARAMRERQSGGRP